MEMRATTADMERLLQALGGCMRLRLVNLMKEGEVCVCFLVGTLDVLEPKISRHLAYLRRSGLVSARRDGKWVHYSLRMPEDAAAAAIVRGVLAWAAGDTEMRRDPARRDAVCCAAPQLVSLGARPKNGTAKAPAQAPLFLPTVTSIM